MTKILKSAPKQHEFALVRPSEEQLYFELDGTPYVAVHLEDNLKHPDSHASLVTVFIVPDAQAFNLAWVEDQIQVITECDDVFKIPFLAGIVFVGRSQPETTCIERIQSALRPRGCIWIRFVSQVPDGVQLFAGPHIVHQGGLRQVYRLYGDRNQAFITSFIPTKDKHSFCELKTGVGSFSNLSVAVPSRMSDLADGVLRGTRLAVKDLFQLEGQKNSLCSRAYHEVCPPAEKTSLSISTLMDAGANVVGFTKLSSLISREEPLEAVDFQTAFNPRGDGYQSPAGSSSGSAVAVAAYDWIDFAIGTDTSGSGRRPALVNGVYQFRPSHELVPREGMIQTFAPWDTPCVFGRDASKLPAFVKAWYNPKQLFVPPKLARDYTLVFPVDYFPVDNRDQMDHIDRFMTLFEQWSGTTTERVSIEETWSKSPPVEARGLDIHDFLDKLNVRTYYHDFFHSTDSFRTAYRNKFQKSPYVNVFVQSIWDMGRKVTSEEYKQGMKDLETYREWFFHHVLRPTERNAVLILPIANIEPNYRNASQPTKPITNAFNSLYLPPILGGPDIVLPIGQWGYQSRISNVQESLPIAVNVVGTPGTDHDFIADIVNFLKHSGLPTKVSTGKTMF